MTLKKKPSNKRQFFEHIDTLNQHSRMHASCSLKKNPIWALKGMKNKTKKYTQNEVMKNKQKHVWINQFLIEVSGFSRLNWKGF